MFLSPRGKIHFPEIWILPIALYLNYILPMYIDGKSKQKEKKKERKKENEKLKHIPFSRCENFFQGNNIKLSISHSLI